MEILTKSTEETQEAGRKFSARVRGGEVIALSGELGSGKTTFLQGFAEGLGIESRIISPTFIIMREYPTKKGNFYHVDLYRLEGNIENELKNLGLTNLWGREANVIAIEWAEKAADTLPESTIKIKFENLGDDERKIIIERKITD